MYSKDKLRNIAKYIADIYRVEAHNYYMSFIKVFFIFKNTLGNYLKNVALLGVPGKKCHGNMKIFKK